MKRLKDMNVKERRAYISKYAKNRYKTDPLFKKKRIAAAIKYRKKNADKTKIVKHAWYIKNRKRILAMSKAYRKKNKK